MKKVFFSIASLLFLLSPLANASTYTATCLCQIESEGIISNKCVYAEEKSKSESAGDRAEALADGTGRALFHECVNNNKGIVSGQCEIQLNGKVIRPSSFSIRECQL